MILFIYDDILVFYCFIVKFIFLVSGSVGSHHYWHLIVALVP